jgi:chromosome segregation protein
MHIKELVLDGFKSFGRRTRIPFYDDFTTISGPNGSGKSNIIDATLFALGLARTSGIRAEKLTDLIYNPGHDDETDELAGEREAIVEVILDNEDRTLERGQVVAAAGTEKVGDIDEIAIRRRVKQTDPETYYSYYYLNDRSVNLGDIRDLLSQAGVTPEGYNVVMQGDVTEIITKTPLRRREIIDEIAGVAAFDAKKDEAFAELETVQERIDEAALRVEEKQARLDQLADERETALEYQALREDKTAYEGHLKAAELEDKRAERTAAVERQTALEETLADQQAELDSRTGTLTRLEEDLADLNAEIERKGEDEQLAIKREIEEVKGEIARVEDRIETATEKIEAAESDRRQAFVQIDRKQETVEERGGELRDVKIRKADLKTDRQELTDELADVEADIEAVDSEYETVRDALEERREELADQKDERSDLQREQDRLLDEARRRTAEQRDLEGEIETATAAIPDLETEIADLEGELEKAAANRSNITSVVEDLTEEKRGLQARLDELDDEISGRQQEYAELEARAGEDGDQSYGRAVTSVLNGNLEGVHGTVGQLGGVAAEYATACETAAGGRLANVVVDDDGVGQRCIEYLKQRNAGRATFLPRNKMQRRSLGSPPERDGVVDYAFNLVDFDPTYEAVFSYVLGDTLVVEDMETARGLMGSVRLVTLEGELVAKSGAMTGGSSSGTRYAFSASGEGRLERVAARIHELTDERERRREALRDVESRLEDARDRQADAAEQVREVETTIATARERLAEQQGRIERLETDLAEIERDRESVTGRMEELDAELDAQNEAIATTEAAIASRKEELTESEIPELTERAEQLREEMAEIDGETDDLDARLNELSLEKQYAEEAIDELHTDIEPRGDPHGEASGRRGSGDGAGRPEDRAVGAEGRGPRGPGEPRGVGEHRPRDRGGASRARGAARGTREGDRDARGGGRGLRPRGDTRSRPGSRGDRQPREQHGRARTRQHARHRGVRHRGWRAGGARGEEGHADRGGRPDHRPHRAVRTAQEGDVHGGLRGDRREVPRGVRPALERRRRAPPGERGRPLRRRADDEGPAGGQARPAAGRDVRWREVSHRAGVHLRHPAVQPRAVLRARRDRRVPRCRQRRDGRRTGRRAGQRSTVRRRLPPGGAARALGASDRRDDAG